MRRRCRPCTTKSHHCRTSGSRVAADGDLPCSSSGCCWLELDLQRHRLGWIQRHR